MWDNANAILLWNFPRLDSLHFFAYRLGNILEDTTTASLALVSHQLHPVLPLLLRLLRKVGRKPWQGLVVS